MKAVRALSSWSPSSSGNNREKLKGILCVEEAWDNLEVGNNREKLKVELYTCFSQLHLNPETIEKN